MSLSVDDNELSRMWSSLETIFNSPELNRDQNRISLLLGYCYVITIPALTFFIVYYLSMTKEYLTTGVNMGICLIFIAFMIILVKFKSGKIISFLAIGSSTLFILLFLYYTVFGVAKGSSIVWMYLFPFITFQFLGVKKGLYWVSGVLILTGFILSFPDICGTFPYGATFKVRFYIVLIIISLTAYGSESFRSRAEEKIVNEQKRLEKALYEIKILRGIIPICSSCKKIRDDEGSWEQMEQYVEQHSEAKFSHGICPKCIEMLYGKEPWFKKVKQST